MKRLIVLLLTLCLSSVCWGQITTSHPVANTVRMTNWLMDGSYLLPWDPYRIDNHGTTAVVITKIDLPTNLSMSSPNGQNNCTNLGPLVLMPGQGCQLYLGYKPKNLGHTFEGWIKVHMTDLNGKPLPTWVDAVHGFGCPEGWSQFQCFTYNAGW